MPVVLVSGALIGYGGVLFGRWLGGFLKVRGSISTITGPELVGVLLACVAGAFIAIALHELGHVLAGLSQGFRFYLYVVGPLRVRRLGDRIEFGWNTNIQLAGGLASCVPVDSRPDLARRMAVMVAGGPLSSLLIAAALIALGNILPAGELRWFAWVCGLMSAMVFLATIVPIRTSSFHSDGARLVMYWFRRDEMTRWARSAALAAMALSSTAPRDWPVPLLVEARQSMDESMDGIGIASMLYYRELDIGDFEAAAAFLDHMLEHREKYPEPFRPTLCLEGAWFEGVIRKRPEVARSWLNQSKGGVMVEPQSRLRSEAAVLRAEGDLTASLAKANEADAILDRMKVRFGFHEAERRMLEHTRRLLHERSIKTA